MKYIVYLTTNIKNNHIYVGVHETETPEKFDGYLGNGLNRNKPSCLNNPKEPFHYAVKKYGFDAFKRSTIQVFDTKEEALLLEALIVNDDFIKRTDTYNITLGGGTPPRKDKIIYQYNLEGKFIKEWKSLTTAANEYNTSSNLIGIAATYKRTAINYLWSFEKYDCLDITEYNVYNPKIPVYIYDSNGNFYKSFNSISECARELNSNISHILRSIKTETKTKGYYISLTLENLFTNHKKSRLSGAVHQYNLDGSYIQSFKSIKEAENKLNTKLSGINNSIRLGEAYKGFLWLRGEKLDYVKPYITPKTKARKIGQYTINNELVKVWDTVRECRKEFPNVSKVLSGQANHCHNYIFKYIE